ncbi:MAG TPA: MerR family transcriptional regulator [Streptosporangiaceae bacterium]|jgi:hypothetical protein|nr:MerR family transcriptional regulator [Streptosporangiaceae bacterium]
MADLGYSVGAVARRLGVSASTLRTWNRRYGIGADGHTPGHHRRYTAEDVTRLEYMQRLILRGAPPADAARAARSWDLITTGPGALDAFAVHQGPGHGSGGRRLALRGGSGPARGLARAALALDDRLISDTIRDALARDGASSTWLDLLVPVFIALGRSTERTGTPIEAEHLLTSATIAALSGQPLGGPGLAGQRAVLLACQPMERHSLALFALAASLADRGVATRMLGADLPYRALADAIRRSGPAAVFLWSQQASTGDPGPLAALPTQRPGVRLLLGGPGWWQDDLPAGVELVHTLPEAIAGVLGALGLA